MSRIASYPVAIPDGVSVTMNSELIEIKGSHGVLNHKLHPLVKIEQVDNSLTFTTLNDSIEARTNSGTMRSKIANMVHGVTEKFVKKLELRGVGYRAQVQGDKVQLTLGYSHPVHYRLPDGITAESPSQTEINIIGIDKQSVGQVAAEIRALRPPEPYQGKGVRYLDEHIPLKEVKKK